MPSISSKSKDSGSWDLILGHNNWDRIDTNGNSEKLLKWCLRNKMLITNSLFRMKRIHRESWGRQGGQESPCIFNYYFDYVLKVAACEIAKQHPVGWGIDEYNIPHFCTNREQHRSGKLNGVQIYNPMENGRGSIIFVHVWLDLQNVMQSLHWSVSTARHWSQIAHHGYNISQDKARSVVSEDMDELNDKRMEV